MLQQQADRGRVGLIALDEAHLLFEWEHFRKGMLVINAALGETCRLCYVLCRPSFKSLRRILTHFLKVPVMALTATAPPDLALLLEKVLQNQEILEVQ